MTKNDSLPLFETKLAKGRFPFLLFATTIFSGICLITVYRTSFLPPREEASRRYAWIGLFLAELWFGLYWFITAVVRWSPFYRYTFKDRLSLRSRHLCVCIYIFIYFVFKHSFLKIYEKLTVSIYRTLSCRIFFLVFWCV